MRGGEDDKLAGSEKHQEAYIVRVIITKRIPGVMMKKDLNKLVSTKLNRKCC